MNWLCPLVFWPDDCLSHGIMIWICAAVLIFAFVVGTIIPFIIRIKEKLKERQFKNDKME